MKKEIPAPIKTPSLVHVPTEELPEALQKQVKDIERKYANRIRKLKRIKNASKKSK
jgi:hypothetical protein